MNIGDVTITEGADDTPTGVTLTVEVSTPDRQHAMALQEQIVGLGLLQETHRSEELWVSCKLYLARMV